MPQIDMFHLESKYNPHLILNFRSCLYDCQIFVNYLIVRFYFEYLSYYYLHNLNGQYCLLKNNLLTKIKYKTKRFFYKNVDEQYLMNNFTSIQNLMKEYNSLYKYIKNNNPNILNVLKYYDINYIEQLLNTVDTLNNFRNKYRLVFKISYTDFEYKTYINNYFKYKNYDKYFLLDFNLNEIKNICLKYEGVIKFKKDFNKIYKYLCKNKLIDECFEHLDTLKFRNNKL